MVYYGALYLRSMLYILGLGDVRNKKAKSLQTSPLKNVVHQFVIFFLLRLYCYIYST